MGRKLQATDFKAEMIREEIRETTRCMAVVATFAAWPVYRTRMGMPTASVADVRDAVPFARELGLSWWACFALYLVKFAAIVMAADCWTYWKHRSLHDRWLWRFHKLHHRFKDPSCFAGFALHPLEAFLTFFPIVFFMSTFLSAPR